MFVSPPALPVIGPLRCGRRCKDIISFQFCNTLQAPFLIPNSLYGRSMERPPPPQSRDARLVRPPSSPSPPTLSTKGAMLLINPCYKSYLSYKSYPSDSSATSNYSEGSIPVSIYHRRCYPSATSACSPTSKHNSKSQRHPCT